MSLVKLYEKYLLAIEAGDDAAWEAYHEIVNQGRKGAGKERDPHRLYVTDLHKCRRALAYRMNGEPAMPPTLAKRIMFRQSEDIEWHAAAAALYAGELEAFQFGVNISDRENWGGRGDIKLKGNRIKEVKTMRSNAFQGSRADGIPKAEHETQASVYHHYEKSSTDDLVYFDRGGSNAPVEVAVMISSMHEISKLMDECEDARESAKQGVMPPLLPPVLSLKGKRKSNVDIDGIGRVSWSGEIWSGPDWRCSYCDYEGCPNKYGIPSDLLCKTTTKGVEWTSYGRKRMDEVIEFMRGVV